MTAKNIDELISELKAAGVLKTPRLVDAFRHIDRMRFMPSELRARAYDDIPWPIGFDQTISQPLTVAIMLEALQPQKQEHVLDVGAGSGWVTALLAKLVGPRGSVMALERIPQLAEMARTNIKPFGFAQATVIAGDASRGYPAGSPYDVIHVAAATDEIPEAYRHQLAVGGRLIVPVGEQIQDLALITKTSDNTYTERRLSGFQFVPLISSS